MFESVGRSLDPDWPLRQLLAAVLLGCTVLCTGFFSLTAWLGWQLALLFWSLLSLLLSLWLGILLPPLPDLMVWLEPEPVEVRLVSLDDGPLELDESDDLLSEALPQLEVPELVLPEPAPVRRQAPADTRVEELASSMLLMKIIGTTGDSDGGVVANLWSDDDGTDLVASLDAAIFDAEEPSAADMVGIEVASRVAEIGSIEAGVPGGVEGGVLGGVVGGVLGGVGDDRDSPASVLSLDAPTLPSSFVERGFTFVACTARVGVNSRGRGELEDWLDCPEEVRGDAAGSIRRARYAPATRSGKPVGATLDVVVELRAAG